MNFSEENAHYRTLAEYNQVILPQYWKVKNTDWQLVRELILKRWRQVNAEQIRAFFQRQQAPEYLSCRHLLTKYNPNPRGGYPSRLVYPRHDFYPIWGYCPLAFDRTRRIPVDTMAPRQKPELRLAEGETYFRYNNYLIRPQKIIVDENGARVLPTWGADERELAWQNHTNPRAFIGEQLNAVARFLHKDETLAILLKTGAPRLAQIHNETETLGYVAYFFDCWRRFHEYEQARPAATVLADTGAATSKLTLRQVALLHAYENKVISKTADEIAQRYGHQSGAKLYEHYLTVSQRAGRIGEDIQGQKLVPMIKDITRIIPHLNDTGQQQAESELKTLNARK